MQRKRPNDRISADEWNRALVDSEIFRSGGLSSGGVNFTQYPLLDSQSMADLTDLLGTPPEINPNDPSNEQTLQNAVVAATGILPPFSVLYSTTTEVSDSSGNIYAMRNWHFNRPTGTTYQAFYTSNHVPMICNKPTEMYNQYGYTQFDANGEPVMQAGETRWMMPLEPMVQGQKYVLRARTFGNDDVNLQEYANGRACWWNGKSSSSSNMYLEPVTTGKRIEFIVSRTENTLSLNNHNLFWEICDLIKQGNCDFYVGSESWSVTDEERKYAQSGSPCTILYQLPDNLNDPLSDLHIGYDNYNQYNYTNLGNLGITYNSCMRLVDNNGDATSFLYLTGNIHNGCAYYFDPYYQDLRRGYGLVPDYDRGLFLCTQLEAAHQLPGYPPEYKDIDNAYLVGRNKAEYKAGEDCVYVEAIYNTILDTDQQEETATGYRIVYPIANTPYNADTEPDPLSDDSKSSGIKKGVFVKKSMGMLEPLGVSVTPQPAILSKEESFITVGIATEESFKEYKQTTSKEVGKYKKVGSFKAPGKDKDGKTTEIAYVVWHKYEEVTDTPYTFLAIYSFSSGIGLGRYDPVYIRRREVDTYANGFIKYRSWATSNNNLGFVKYKDYQDTGEETYRLYPPSVGSFMLLTPDSIFASVQDALKELGIEKKEDGYYKGNQKVCGSSDNDLKEYLQKLGKYVKEWFGGVTLDCTDGWYYGYYNTKKGTSGQDEVQCGCFKFYASWICRDLTNYFTETGRTVDSKGIITIKVKPKKRDDDGGFDMVFTSTPDKLYGITFDSSKAQKTWVPALSANMDDGEILIPGLLVEAGKKTIQLTDNTYFSYYVVTAPSEYHGTMEGTPELTACKLKTDDDDKISCSGISKLSELSEYGEPDVYEQLGVKMNSGRPVIREQYGAFNDCENVGNLSVMVKTDSSGRHYSIPVRLDYVPYGYAVSTRSSVCFFKSSGDNCSPQLRKLKFDVVRRDSQLLLTGACYVPSGAITKSMTTKSE